MGPEPEKCEVPVVTKSDINRMNINEFRKKGFLQEANRLFFHPLGLALEVEIDDDGNEKLGGIWDYRNDPEGMLFGKGMIDRDKIDHVLDLKNSKRDARIKLFGGFIQYD